MDRNVFFCLCAITAFYACEGPEAVRGPVLVPQPETGDTTGTREVIGTLDTAYALDAEYASNAPIPLVPHAVKLEKGTAFDYMVPRGYELTVAGEGMERPRFLSPSPDGRLFLTDMHNMTDNRKGRVLILDEWNEATGSFAGRHTYLSGLHNPNQVSFHKIGGQRYIYVATTDRLLRYPYAPGDTVPSAEPLVIDTFPAYGLGYKYGGWHLTRSLAFHGEKLYVSVGSSCNACVEKEEVRACILEMDPDGSNARIYAKGLRNAVDMQWIGDELYVTIMGSDQFGADEPQDQLQRITDGADLGWPYYAQFSDRIVSDTAFLKPGMEVLHPAPSSAYANLGAHVAPLGLAYVQGSNDTLLNNRFLVALHGSSIVKMAKGYAIVSVKRGTPDRPVVSGFLQGSMRYGRPCAILQRNGDSFWFTDDMNGVLYLLRKKK